MAEWQEKVQSMIIGFVFAFMVMKLVSMISSFRAANLRVTRGSNEEGTLGPVVELGDEQSVPLVGTDEEVELDGGEEKEDRASVPSSSSSESESENDAAPASKPREIDNTDEVGDSKGESKDEGVESQNHEEVEEIFTPGAQS
ncbi:uncharacterized protein [Physcomitrium patens]|uniref:Uncharacterized protein n=1 Tax=Physcomitrium patens TaxID=3218 RepID=A9U0U8_PHYPA|nr:acyl-CoA-binding domain-containing protein 4-like [Physcomitrium patens]PNR51607.1 hypothetical protein PHYPA_010794 [Physcomitrium patens]|eukprot:XP_024380604.1 acyl-CoA-binding domain-containing protein 4-like [Physcomitrella patens]